MVGSERRAGWALSYPCYAPADIRAKRGHSDMKGRELTVETDFIEHGISFSPAQMNRQAGFVRINEMLAPDFGKVERERGPRVFPEWHPRSGEPGSPKLFVSRRCEKLIAQLRSAPVEDVGQWRGEAVKGAWESEHGHAIAALRYGLLTRFPIAQKPESSEDLDPRSLALRQYEQKLAENASLFV